jgi:hypothetical protein
MNKQKIAHTYAQATKLQGTATHQFNMSLCSLGSDNYVFSLAEPIESAYTALVEELLGPEPFEWLTWWIYETDYGTQNMTFEINGQDYDPTQLDFDQFWRLVNA